MKRFILLFTFVLVLAALVQTSDISQLPPSDYEHIFYTSSGEIAVKPKDAYKTRKSIDVHAEAVRFEGTLNTARNAVRSMGGTVIREEKVDGITILYAFTARLDSCELSFGKVSLMVAVNGKTITAASPLIYGSY